jgi:hypothetical protein
MPVNATNPLPPEGAVPSGPAGVLDTPDGWHLEVVGANETQLPVAPLTTAISSREYDSIPSQSPGQFTAPRVTCGPGEARCRDKRRAA